MSTYCVSVQWYSVSKEFPRNLIQSPLCPWPTTKRGYRKVILGYCCHLMLRVPQHLFQYFTKNFTGGLGYTKTHLFLSLDFPLTSVTSIIFFNESSELNIDVSISCAILPLCKPHASASHFAAHRRNMVEQE